MKRIRLEEMTVRMLAWTYLMCVEGFRVSKRVGFEHIPAPDKDFSKVLVQNNGHTIRFDAVYGYPYGAVWITGLIEKRRPSLSPLPEGRWLAERNGVVGEHASVAGAILMQAIRESAAGAIDYPIPEQLDA